nr:hypothetical protein [Tanacetum cinerariifolium]
MTGQLRDCSHVGFFMPPSYSQVSIPFRRTPAEDVSQAACSISTFFADVATSMDDVGVSEICLSGGCMPHVVTTATFVDMATTIKLDPNYGDKGKMIITGPGITNVADLQPTNSNKIE